MAQHISQHTAPARRRHRRHIRAAAALTATILILGAGGGTLLWERARRIGVVSGKRDKDGLPCIIHNMGQRHRENDYLSFRTHMSVTGRYRFDASRIPADVPRARD